MSTNHKKRCCFFVPERIRQEYQGYSSYVTCGAEWMCPACLLGRWHQKECPTDRRKVYWALQTILLKSDVVYIVFQNQWKSMENHWKSTKTNENQRKSMKINENQWKINGKSMKICENQWKFYQLQTSKEPFSATRRSWMDHRSMDTSRKHHRSPFPRSPGPETSLGCIGATRNSRQQFPKKKSVVFGE